MPDAHKALSRSTARTALPEPARPGHACSGLPLHKFRAAASASFRSGTTHAVIAWLPTRRCRGYVPCPASLKKSV